MTIRNILITSLFLVALVFIGVQLSDRPTVGGFTSQGCTVNTVTAVALNTNTSGTVLAAHSRRAWARIQQQSNPTDDVWLSFDEGAAAAASAGLLLADSNNSTSTSPTFIDFGLNTNFPYTGEVTGIAPVATTTVLVTECRY